MKKLAFLITAVATLASGTGAYAQTSTTKASQAGTSTGLNTGMAWGIAIIGIAVVVAVAVGTGCCSGRTPSTATN